MNKLNPDWTVCVGEIIEEHLEANNIKKNTFADLIGKTPKWVSEFLCGKAPLTVETALDMERVLPYNAEFLMRVEIANRIFLARKETENE